MIRCLGVCGRELPADRFHRNGPHRRRWCRDCRQGRAPSPHDPDALADRFEDALSRYRDRRIGWDDLAFADLRRAVVTAVEASGPIVRAGVRLGVDWTTGDVSRTTIRGGPR